MGKIRRADTVPGRGHGERHRLLRNSGDERFKDGTDE
jgi:hypothetical protein